MRENPSRLPRNFVKSISAVPIPDHLAIRSGGGQIKTARISRAGILVNIVLTPWVLKIGCPLHEGSNPSWRSAQIIETLWIISNQGKITVHIGFSGAVNPGLRCLHLAPSENFPEIGHRQTCHNTDEGKYNKDLHQGKTTGFAKG